MTKNYVLSILSHRRLDWSSEKIQYLSKGLELIRDRVWFETMSPVLEPTIEKGKTNPKPIFVWYVITSLVWSYSYIT